MLACGIGVCTGLKRRISIKNEGGSIMYGTEWRKRPPSYELFFAPLVIAFEPNITEGIHLAYIASKYGHAKQVRDDGSRFFDHPKSAAWIYINELDGRDPRIIIDALLHDIPEDSYLLSPYRINLNLGKDVALDLRAITKLPKGKETYESYLNRIITRGPHITIAKLCDNLHNVRTLCGCPMEKQKKNLKETKEKILPWLMPPLQMQGNVWATHALVLKEKFQEAIAEIEKNF